MLYYTRIFICHERSLRRTSDNNCQCLLSLAQEPRQHETESEGKKGEDTRTKEAQTTKPCFVVCALGPPISVPVLKAPSAVSDHAVLTIVATESEQVISIFYCLPTTTDT